MKRRPLFSPRDPRRGLLLVEAGAGFRSPPTEPGRYAINAGAFDYERRGEHVEVWVEAFEPDGAAVASVPIYETGPDGRREVERFRHYVDPRRLRRVAP